MKSGEVWEHKMYDIKLEIIDLYDNGINYFITRCNDENTDWVVGSHGFLHMSVLRQWWKKDWSHEGR